MAFDWLTRWLPWTEDRAALDGGDSAINTALAALDSFYSRGGVQANVHRTAAVEFALGMIGRSFMLAEPMPALPALSPATLAMLGRRTMLGNAVFTIDFDRRAGEISLTPVAKYTVAGGVQPDSWRYAYRQGRPNGDNPLYADDLPEQNRSYEGMVHVRYNPPPAEPWKGVSPLEAAGLTAEQLANIERSLAYDASPPAGLLMPMPDGASSEIINTIRGALTTGRGGLTPIETTAHAFGQGQFAAPRGDYEQKRFGPMMQTANVSFRDSTFLQVLAACGIPPALYTSQGAALRAAHNHFIEDTCGALGKLISRELSAKLDQTIEFTFPQAFRSDMSARSRAYSSLKQAEVEPGRAGRIVGLPL